MTTVSHDRSTVSRKLNIPRMREKVEDRAFTTFGPKLWTTLPTSLHDMDSVASFEAGLRTHLFTQYSSISAGYTDIGASSFIVRTVFYHHSGLFFVSSFCGFEC